MPTVEDIIIHIKGDIEGLKTSLDNAKTDLDSFGERARNTGKVMAGAFAAIGGTVLYTTDKFMEFNVRLDQVRVISKATDTEIKELKDSALRLSDGVYSSKQLADSYKVLATEGYNVNNSLKIMPDLLALAKAGNVDLGMVAGEVTDIMSLYKLSIDDVADASDAMMHIVTTTGDSLESVIATMKNLGPIATGAGMSFDEVAGFIAIFAAQGMNASDAAQSLTFAIRNLSDPSKEIEDAFKSLGIPLYDNQVQLDGLSLEMKDHQVVLDDLKGKLGEVEEAYGSTQTAMLELQGQMDVLSLEMSKKELEIKKIERALRDAGKTPGEIAEAVRPLRDEIDNLRLTGDEYRIKQMELRLESGKQKEAMDSLTASMKPHIGAIENTTKTMEEAKEHTLPFKDLLVDLSAKFAAMPDGPEKAGMAVQLFGRQSGEMLKVMSLGPEAIRNMSEESLEAQGITLGMAEAVDKNISPMKKLTDSWDDFILDIGGALSPMADAGAAISGIGMSIGGLMMVWPQLIAAIGFLKGAIIGLTAFMLANPIILAIAGIALAIIALKLAWDSNFGGIQEKTAAVFDFIRELWDWFVSFLMEKKELIINILTLLLGPIGMIIFAFRNWEQIKVVVSNIIDWLTEKLTGLASEAWNWGKNLISGFINGIKSMFGSLKNIAGEIADTIAKFIGISSPAKTGPLRYLEDWGPNLVKTFAKGIRDNLGIISDQFDNFLAETEARMSDMTIGISPGISPAKVETHYHTHAWSIHIDTIENRADADYLLDEIERRIVKKTAVSGVF